MEDPNSIAWLLPANSEGNSKQTWDAMRKSENRSQYIDSQGETRSNNFSPESTASVADNEDALNPASYPRLHITFNNGPKVGQRFVIGKDPNSCDIVLPSQFNISWCHCYLSFDAQRQLILQDNSSHGTIVTYDGSGWEKRRTLVGYDKKGQEIHHHFTWILSGNDVPDKTKKIVIEIEKVKFPSFSQSTWYIQMFSWAISTGFSIKMTSFLLPDLTFRAQN